MKKLLLFLVAVMTAWGASAASHTVYFDNTSAKYTEPHCYAWKGNTNNTWCGPKMVKEDGNIYSYTTDVEYSNLIFSDNGSNQTGNLDWADGHLYTKDGDQGVYTPTEGTNIIYFDNSVANFSNPYCYAYAGSSNNVWPGGKMQLVEGTIYSYATSATYSTIIFSDYGSNQLDKMTWANGHLYNKSGDQGEYATESGEDQGETGGDEGEDQGETTVDYTGWYFNLRYASNSYSDNGIKVGEDGTATQSELAVGTDYFNVKIWNGSKDVFYYTPGEIAQNEAVQLQECSIDDHMKIAGATDGQKFNFTFDCATNKLTVVPVETGETGGDEGEGETGGDDQESSVTVDGNVTTYRGTCTGNVATDDATYTVTVTTVGTTVTINCKFNGSYTGACGYVQMLESNKIGVTKEYGPNYSTEFTAELTDQTVGSVLYIKGKLSHANGDAYTEILEYTIPEVEGETGGDEGETTVDYTGWYFNLRYASNSYSDNGIKVGEDGTATQSELAVGTDYFNVKIWNGSNDVFYYAPGEIAQNEAVQLKECGIDDHMKIAGATDGQKFNFTFDCATNKLTVVPVETGETGGDEGEDQGETGGDEGETGGDDQEDASAMILTGTFNSWATTSSDYKMTQDGDTYTLKLDKLEAGSQFKVKTNVDNWDNSYGAEGEGDDVEYVDNVTTKSLSGTSYNNDYSATATITTNNTTVTVSIAFDGEYQEAGGYVFEVNEAGGILSEGSRTASSTTVTRTFTDQAVGTTLMFKGKLEFAGGLVETEVIKYVVPETRAHKVTVDNQLNAWKGSSINFYVKEEITDAVVTFVKNEDGASTLTVTSEAPVVKDYVLTGNFSSLNWPLTSEAGAVKMEYNSSDATYYCTVTLVSGNLFKIKLDEDQWGEEYGPDSTENLEIQPNVDNIVKSGSSNSFKVAEGYEGGSSKVVFNPTNMTISYGVYSSGIEAVEAGVAVATPIYYNLQGIRVMNPVAGQVYIMNQGGKVSKVLFR